MTFAEVRATERQDDALRVASIVIIEGAAVPEQRFLPGPETGRRVSSKEGVAVAEQNYEGMGMWL